MSEFIDTDFELVDEQVHGDALDQRLFVPERLACLEGHFPGLPVVPGLAQLDLVVRAVARLRGPDVVVAGLEALKFRELLRPGESFALRVEAPPERGRAVFRVVRGGRDVASGRVLLAKDLAPLPDAPIPPPKGGEGDVGRDARDVLPQAGPMVFLDRVLRTEEKRTACSCRVESLALFRDAAGGLPGWAAIEPMAQCIAAHGGLEARRRGVAPRVGFLLGTRRLRIGAARLDPGTPYVVVAEQVWGGDEGLVSFDCSVYEGSAGRCLLAGRINAYLPSDLGELGQGGRGE